MRRKVIHYPGTTLNGRRLTLCGIHSPNLTRIRTLITCRRCSCSALFADLDALEAATGHPKPRH